jgi:hypothetical protein
MVREEESLMETTLAVIGALAIVVWFIRAIGLKEINIVLDGKPLFFRTRRTIAENEKPPKQLNK